MIFVSGVILFSAISYFALGYGKRSVLERPSIAQITFFRDYLILTLIPYLYYLSNERYSSHYILENVSSSSVFYQASMHAFIFITLFLAFFRVFDSAFSYQVKKVSITVHDRKLLFFLSILSVISFVYFFAVTYAYDASVLGIAKYSLLELNSLRATLSQGSGFLSFNKTVIKQWIPMISYLWFYLRLTKVRFSLHHRILYYTSILIGALASVWYFEKAVIVFYLLGFCAIYVYAGFRFNKWFVLSIPMVAILLVGGMYALVYQDRITDIRYLMDILLHRSSGQAVGSLMAVEYFVSHETMGVSGISNLWASVVGENFSSPYQFLIDYYVPETYETSGAMSSFAVGEAFGLFGYVGVFVSGIIVAAYYGFFESTKHARLTAYIFVPLYGIYFSHFYVASGFYSFVWPVGMVIAIVPFAAITLMSVRYRL